MKIRIGYGLGTRTGPDPVAFGAIVDALETLRYDSLWLSERIGGEAHDPVVAMTFAAARTTRLKFGTSVMVLPGRNPVVLAKELASLDVLSGGRLLPAFGLGVADPVEQQAFGVERSERGPRFDEALTLMRALWSGEPVTFSGRFHAVDGVRVLPRPRQARLDVWLGGLAPSELRRVGRMGDGWLPSFVTPADVAAGIPAIEAAAAAHDREMDPEHWGVLVLYALDRVPAPLAAAVRTRNPDNDPADIVPVGIPAIRTAIGRFVEAGASKFVLVPVTEPASWGDHLAELADGVLDLQTR